MRNLLLHLLGASLSIAITITASCHVSAQESLNHMVAANHEFCITLKEQLRNFSKEPCRPYKAIVITPPKITNSMIITPPENRRAVVVNPCEDTKDPGIKLDEKREPPRSQKPDIQIAPSVPVNSLNVNERD